MITILLAYVRTVNHNLEVPSIINQTQFSYTSITNYVPASLIPQNAPCASTPINAYIRNPNAIRNYFNYKKERNRAPWDRNNTLDYFKRLRPSIFMGIPNPIFIEH